MRYGVGTYIQGDNGVFGVSSARAGAPSGLLGAYQGASQPVFQSHIGYPMAYSGLNGQSHVVGSNYHPGILHLTRIPISVPTVTSVLARAHYDVPKTDVHPCDHSAFVCPEPRNTLLRDKWLAQYTAKEGLKNTKDEPGSHIG